MSKSAHRNTVELIEGKPNPVLILQAGGL